ncbi:MAG: SPOR domain-containing protein [Clostridia bacterium]|nr:SPOR domain-containing protein [Clostridia bacterium]
MTEAIVSFGALKKIAKDTNTYYVQAGAFSSKTNAENLVKKLKKAGFSATIKVENK